MLHSLTDFGWNSLFSRRLLILALVQIGMKNEKGVKVFLYCYFSYLTFFFFTFHMACNIFKELKSSVSPGCFFIFFLFK